MEAVEQLPMDSIFLPSPLDDSPPAPQHSRILNFAINRAQQAPNPLLADGAFSQAILPWEVALGMPSSARVA
jgi:hypothetical protein